jgi:hypothetical protein
MAASQDRTARRSGLFPDAVTIGAFQLHERPTHGMRVGKSCRSQSGVNSQDAFV